MRGRRRQVKRRLQSEFGVFQSSFAAIPSRFLCRMYANSSGVEFLRAQYTSKEGERKFRRCLFTSSIKHEIRHFHVVVVQKRQRNAQKIKTIAFMTFSLPSPSSDLKVPIFFLSL